MGVGAGTALLIAGGVSALASIGSGYMASAATAAQGRNLANLQRAQAQQQAAILRSNADKSMLDKRAMEVKASIEKRELQRRNKIAQGERLVAAAGSGFEINGTTIQDVLDLEKSHDALGEATLGWEWKNRISRKLDEANVARFGSFLKEFAADTQFIVVTHRKGTMEAVDTMYGVTIEDAGVSKVLSVKLGEVESA